MDLFFVKRKVEMSIPEESMEGGRREYSISRTKGRNIISATVYREPTKRLLGLTWKEGGSPQERNTYGKCQRTNV